MAMRSASAPPTTSTQTNQISSNHNATDTWQQAVKDYTNGLSPAQQLAFKAPATVDQCLQVLADNRSRKKAFTRILEFFRPLIDPLKRFEGAIDVVVQTSSGIASPIWGPLRLAITIASDHFRTLERLAFIVDKVASSIRRYQDFEVLFALHASVRNAIGTLYCDLIYFCTRVVRFHTRSFRYPFVSFEKEFGSISESIDLHGAEVDRAANAAHMKEAKEARERMLAEKQAQNLHQLQCWLSPSTVEDDLQKHQNEYLIGSSDWVVMSTELDNWLHAPLNNFLQIVGRPGSGKSTLAAFLVQHLSKSSSYVLYFFCNGNDSEKRENIYVLRTLLAQLLKVDSSLANHILPVYQQSGRLFADSYQVVSDAFRTAMVQQQDHAIYMIIDAVDECRGAWDYTGLLAQLQSCTENTKVKFVITQRDVGETYGHGRWCQATHKLTVKPECASPYIQEYVKQRVHRMVPIANTGLEAQVVRQISESSDGLWLYARLMLDEVEHAPSEERVKRRLKSLPHGLSDLYTQVLRSCEERMTEDHRQFAKHLYIWLDVSDYMPSFWSDDFDRLQYHMLKLIFRFVNGGNEVFDAAALARELGSPLIQVHEIDSTYELDFVHRSAYQYLVDSSRLSFKELPPILIPQRLKKLHRGVTAVWYFTQCSDSAQQLEDLKEPSKLGEIFGSGSYFEMAYGLWNAFSQSDLPVDLSRKEMVEAENLLRRLTEFLDSGEALRWFEMATIINYSGNYIQLLDNVLWVLHISQLTCTYPCAAFQNFDDQRCSFFLDWAYVLRRTTPWRRKNEGYMAMKKPRDFDKNETAVRMMLIAQQWGNTSFEGFSYYMNSSATASDDSSDEDMKISFRERRSKFSMGDHLRQNGHMTVCAHCSMEVEGYKLQMHLDFACEAYAKNQRQRTKNQQRRKQVDKLCSNPNILPSSAEKKNNDFIAAPILEIDGIELELEQRMS